MLFNVFLDIIVMLLQQEVENEKGRALVKLDIDYKAIGLRIKASRARKGLTQGNIAKLTGLSTPHISNIETGNTKLGLPYYYSSCKCA